MKKRLRKKKRLAEFTQYLAHIVFSIKYNVEADVVMDAFLSKIDELKLSCGGTWTTRDLQNGADMHVEIGNRIHADRNLEKIEDWIKANPHIDKYKFDPKFENVYYPKNMDYTEEDLKKDKEFYNSLFE